MKFTIIVIENFMGKGKYVKKEPIFYKPIQLYQELYAERR